MPEPEEKVVEPATPAEEATTAAPETEDFAGYESLEAMKAAIYASRKEGKRLAEENASLRAETAGRRLPSESRAERNVWKEIDDLGLPPELLERAIDDRFDRKLAPKQNTDAAVANIRRANPDFARFEAQFTDWLADNPQVGLTYANTVAAAPESAELALEGVFAQFSRAAAAAVKKPAAPSKISPDAALPDTQNTGGSTRRGAPPKLSPADVRELIKGARDNNDPVPLMRAMGMGTLIPVHRDIESKKG